MKEVFKDVPGYENRYQVSEFGILKSIINVKEVILKPV